MDPVDAVGDPGGPAVMASMWWESFADVVPPWFARYLTLERTASLLRTCEVQFLPGLFQTAAYARAVIGSAYDDPVAVERRVDLRQARQRLLDQADPPEIQAVIVEGALTQPPMTPSQRQAQLDRLIALADRPNISIMIVPSTVAANVTGPSFTILSFTDPALADVAYVEEADDARYLVEPSDVAHYARLLADLNMPERSTDETRSTLRRLRGRV
jgi:hypothetical protein